MKPCKLFFISHRTENWSMCPGSETLKVQVQWSPGPKTNENCVEIFRAFRTCYFFMPFQKFYFYKYLLAEEFWVFLAGIVSSHRDVESSRMKWSIGKERLILILFVDLIPMVSNLLLWLNSNFKVVIYDL